MKSDLAKRIANMLFLDGGTLKYAKRLALVHKEGDSTYMGGWCKRAVIDRIQELIEAEPPHQKDKL